MCTFSPKLKLHNSLMYASTVLIVLKVAPAYKQKRVHNRFGWMRDLAIFRSDTRDPR